MDFSNAAIQVALIAGFVALLGALINFTASLIGHWYARRSRVDAWLFEKRVEVIQGMISKLDHLNDNLEKSFQEEENAFGTLRLWMDGSYEWIRQIPAYDVGIDATTEDVNPGYQGQREKAKELAFVAMDALSGRVAEALNATSVDVPRLGTWLEGSSELEKELKGLCFMHANLLNGLLTFLSTLLDWIEAYPQNFTDLPEDAKAAYLGIGGPPYEELVAMRWSLVEGGEGLKKVLIAEMTGTVEPLWTFIRRSLFSSATSKVSRKR